MDLTACHLGGPLLHGKQLPCSKSRDIAVCDSLRLWVPGRFQGRSLPRNDPCAVLLGRVGRGESALPPHMLLSYESQLFGLSAALCVHRACSQSLEICCILDSRLSHRNSTKSFNVFVSSSRVCFNSNRRLLSNSNAWVCWWSIF